MRETLPTTVSEPALSWARDDIEQKLLFRGGRFTRVNSWCAFSLAVLMTAGFYAVLFPFHDNWIAGSFFFDRNRETPACIVFLSCWSIAILCLKWSKLRMQQRALQLAIVPSDPEFVLTPQTVDEVFHRMHECVDDPRQFVVFHRIMTALSNLRNLGRVTDVDDILRAQADTDESGMETSYSLLQGFVWAIPVLGFIGTVEGLSVAIGGFGNVLSSSTDFEQIKVALRGVTGGLSTAFETTLHGLVAALVIQLIQTALKKSEEEFLDACSEYCSKQIVSRLRLMPFELRGDE
ncbi:MotA/TolQ/ExbB proton channel family protein [Schlesneria paludicola]|uniref:MotA/TolQ/ExbB proton channel family protein n=1 Tax=Schlesneria paludicola TaxID=360056 RepID=UPI00029B252E|nr:MotA/TolQ/ExbB proton channel family protein [Schlesneria paludicola]